MAHRHRPRPEPTAATGPRERRWGARRRAGGRVLRRSEPPRGRDDGCRAPPAASAATSPAALRHRDLARPPAGFAGRTRSARLPEQEPHQGRATAQRAPRAHRPAFGCAAARLHTIACCSIRHRMRGERQCRAAGAQRRSAAAARRACSATGLQCLAGHGGHAFADDQGGRGRSFPRSRGSSRPSGSRWRAAGGRGCARWPASAASSWCSPRSASRSTSWRTNYGFDPHVGAAARLGPGAPTAAVWRLARPARFTGARHALPATGAAAGRLTPAGSRTAVSGRQSEPPGQLLGGDVPPAVAGHGLHA